VAEALVGGRSANIGGDPTAGTWWPPREVMDTQHSPYTEAGWGASLGTGFLQALARLPLLPFNITGTNTKPYSRLHSKSV
jgi:hypothetical protein